MSGWLYGIVIAFTFAGGAVFLFLLRRYVTRLVDRRIFAFQNDIITKHCAEVEHIYSQMRGWRHDYHNHIQALKAYLALEQYPQMSGYLRELDRDLTGVDTLVKTGNVMVDAILNSKLSLAKERSIGVTVTVSVPQKLKVAETDLCVIVGNLLDNAMEACLRMDLKTSPVRSIRVYMGLLKEHLYISVSNTMELAPRKQAHEFSTLKGKGHGFGLLRIDQIVKKYGGYLNRQHEEGVFATEIMLPL